MIVLGIDPGATYVGWAVLTDRKLTDCGQWAAQTAGCTWADTLREHKRLAKALLAEVAPDVVGIEKTSVNHAPVGAQGREVNIGQARAQAAMTQRTSELVAVLTGLAGAAGAEPVLVHPATAKARLGLGTKRATDGQVSKAANMLCGNVQLKASENHIAKAIGVAFAAAARELPHD